MLGTPLTNQTSSLKDDLPSTSQQQRYRSQKQQIVTDDQGRRRFHGAFTGGFSAGYHNSVDSLEGFVPKSFISRRGQKRDPCENAKFSHKPEDYMDSEDVSEFGIAPKKIRVFNKYAYEERAKSTGFHPHQCFGERIFKAMCSNENYERKNLFTQDVRLYPDKDDLFGLGYKPLRSENDKSSKNLRFHDPLDAMFKGGKKIKISGQAFGYGVLNDDDDYEDLITGDMYGHDDIGNYEFQPNKKISRSNQGGSSSKTHFDENLDDPGFIPGFKLSATILLNEKKKYELPSIPKDWKMPSLDIRPVILEKHRSFLANKFVTSSDDVGTSQEQFKIETKSGLVQLRDIKSSFVKKESSIQLEPENSISKLNNEVKINVFEWRPCSLLCKRFNVANPFPDNAFCGVRPGLLKKTADGEEQRYSQASGSSSIHRDGDGEKVYFAAPMYLRRSIYNQVLDEDEKQPVTYQDNLIADENEDDVVIGGGKGSDNTPSSIIIERFQDDYQEVDDDEECIVIPIQRKQPELIVLDSSSSSASSS